MTEPMTKAGRHFLLLLDNGLPRTLGAAVEAILAIEAEALAAVSPVAVEAVDALFSGKADAMTAGEFRAKYPDPREAPASLDAAWIRHARYDFPTQSPEEFVRGWLAAFDMLAARLTLPGGQSR